MCVQGTGCACPDGGVTDCYGRCHDPLNDPTYCGQANVCGGSCVDGACECPPGSNPCNPTAITTGCMRGLYFGCQPDSNSLCGNTCTTCGFGAVCQNSECVCQGWGVTFCDAGCWSNGYNGSDCSGSCALTQADPQNCGSCGVVCPSGVCTAGACQGTLRLLAYDDAGANGPLGAAGGYVFWQDFSASQVRTVKAVSLDGGPPFVFANGLLTLVAGGWVYWMEEWPDGGVSLMTS